jgi:hypothetical protein
MDHLEATAGPTMATQEQLDAVVACHPSGPLQLIYLIKFREQAAYPPDYVGELSPDCTGVEAYTRFGNITMRLVEERGGRLVMINGVDAVAFGETAHDAFDVIAIVEYPSARMYVETLQHAEYVGALVHRTAGLARLEIIATTPVVAGSNGSNGTRR